MEQVHQKIADRKTHNNNKQILNFFITYVFLIDIFGTNFLSDKFLFNTFSVSEHCLSNK